MDFTARGVPDNFFPVKVNFTSPKSYCNMKVLGVSSTSDGAPVNFSIETYLRSSNYEIN